MYKVDLALNNLQWLMCHQPTNQPTNQGLSHFAESLYYNDHVYATYAIIYDNYTSKIFRNIKMRNQCV